VRVRTVSGLFTYPIIRSVVYRVTCQRGALDRVTCQRVMMTGVYHVKVLRMIG